MFGSNTHRAIWSSIAIIGKKKNAGMLLSAVLLGLSAVAQAERYTIPWFLPAGAGGAPQSVLRILNGTDESGSAEIYAIDDAGARIGPASLGLNPWSAVEFTASELQSGDAAKGLPSGLGSLAGDVRLLIDSDVPIVPSAYVRSRDGALAAVHDTVLEARDASTNTHRYDVAVFHPAAGAVQQSRLRLINPGDGAARIAIEARDDTGMAASGGTVELTLPGGAARTLSAQQLEAGDGAAFTGRLGAGVGNWRLSVVADRPIQALNLTVGANGDWSNLSTTAVTGWAPEDAAALEARFLDRVIVSRDGLDRLELRVLAENRIRDTRLEDGVRFSEEGGYGYERTGRDAGILTLLYDSGQLCAATIYFDSPTSGWYVSGCVDSANAAEYRTGGGWWTLDLGAVPLDLGPALEHMTYAAGTAIAAVTLPAATGGDGDLMYSLSPEVPGLQFDAETRRLSGTPSEAGDWAMTYRVRDATGDTDWRYFSITVQAAGGATLTYQVGETLSSLPAGSWVPDVSSGASFASSGGNTTIEFNDGGYIEEGDYRYTCRSGGGCRIQDRDVESGTIVRTAKGTGPDNGGAGSAGALRRLTYHNAWDHDPSWSPDGQRIVVSSNRDFNYEIYTIDADGGNPQRLTDHDATDSHPAWSPDGQRIAFVSSRNGNREIYAMGADGGNPQRLTDHGATDVSPAWSPDGQRIAFHSNRDGNWEIYTMDADGGSPQRLTDHVATDAAPAWSPDGQRVAFHSTRDGNWEIYTMDADGGNPQRLTDHDASDSQPAWSPDGQRIAFVSSRDGNWEIYAMDADGGNTQRLTDNNATDTSPAWSPDGQHIAFGSNRDGNWEIYSLVVPVPDAGQDSQPRFTTGSGPGDQTYTVGTTISALTLPEARGGDGPLTYSLSPAVPGLSFNATATVRRLTGTPSTADTYNMTYRVRDTDGDTDSLTFTITVENAGGGSGDSDDHGDDRTSATRVDLESDTQGNLSGGDVDYFRVNVDAAGMLEVYTSGDVDTVGELQDSTGSPIDDNDDGGVSLNFRIAADVSAGVYYVRVSGYSSRTAGDYTLHVRFDESPPTENEPDLVVESASVSDSSPEAGASFTLSATVRNRGNGRSGSTTLRYYRSTNATISTSDTAVGTDAVAALSASGVSAESTRLTAPSSTGTYYYGACVDSVSGESDTSNNCSSAVRVTVSGGTTGGTTYEPLAGLRVSPGRVQFIFSSSGGCIRLSNSTFNGVTYTSHSSRWQRRENAGSPWQDVPGTEQQGGLCAYDPTASGEYRMIADITVGGNRASYSSENTFTVN